MNSTIKTLINTCCITFACLALVACGGGDSDSDTGGNGGSSSTGGGSSTSEQTPAYRVVDDFATHMANREFGQARELVREGGDASKLDDYLKGMDTQMANPNTAQFMDPMFTPITEAFANAGIEVVEEDDSNAVVRMTVGDESYDLNVGTLDGSEWTIELPQGMLKSFDELLMDVIPNLQDNGG